jgi:hypothetical protein
MYWCGFYLAFLGYSLAKKDESSSVITIKNIIVLGLVFSAILFHFLLQDLFLTLAISLISCYAISLLITAYEEKFILGMEVLFNLKSQTTIKTVFIF